MNIQVIYEETELIIYTDASDSDLPTLYNREPVGDTFGMQSMCSGGWYSWAEQSPKKESTLFLPKGDKWMRSHRSPANSV